jgi:uncharacterized protein YcbK (DUF882 family)
MLKILVAGSMVPSILGPFDGEVKAASLKSLCSGKLSFRNIHTNEALEISYLNRKGGFNSMALTKLNHLFRCHFNGRAHRINPDLFLLLDAVRSQLKVRQRPYLLISGYRSPRYNLLLRRKGHGVARNSYHLKGMAADVCIDGVPMAELREAAVSCKVGGVGCYSDFVHLDVGPMRHW